MSATAWQHKLDSQLLALWKRVAEPDRRLCKARVLLRYTGPIDAIEGPGIEIYSVVGDVASASVDLEKLPRVAVTPSILFLELASPLTPDL